MIEHTTRPDSGYGVGNEDGTTRHCSAGVVASGTTVDIRNGEHWIHQFDEIAAIHMAGAPGGREGGSVQ